MLQAWVGEARVALPDTSDLIAELLWRGALLRVRPARRGKLYWLHIVASEKLT